MTLCPLRDLAVRVLAISLLAAPALAADGDQELLDILLENGSITQEQNDSLKARDEVTSQAMIMQPFL